MSSNQIKINFCIEKEKGGCFDEKFATQIYRKKTFSGVYTNFKSFIIRKYKIGLIKSLLLRCLSLCFYFIKVHHEVDKLKSTLYKNRYPHDLADKCIKNILEKTLAPKTIASAVPQKDLVIALPYLGKLSLHVCTRTIRIMNKKLLCCNIRFIFQIKFKISNFFCFYRKNSIVLAFWHCLQISVWWLQCYLIWQH